MITVISSLFFVILETNGDEFGILISETYNPEKPNFYLLNSNEFIDSLYESQIFMDKSLLIKELLEDNGKQYFINCPRLWGKSTNIGMISTFLRIQVDSNGTPVPPPDTLAYRLFIHGEVQLKNNIKKFKSPMIIANHIDIVHAHLARYPVIHFSILEIVYEPTFANILETFSKCISQVYQQYNYIADKYREMINSGDNQTSKIITQRLTTMEYFLAEKPRRDVEKVVNSLRHLSEILYEYFNASVYIMIDDYFTLTETIFVDESARPEDVSNFESFYQKFLQETFIRNKYLEKGILVDAYSPSRELRETVLRTFTECNFLTGKFMKYYGLNGREIQCISDYLHCGRHTRTKLEEWYDGYKSNGTNIQFYNMWSVLNYFNSKKFTRHWIFTGDMKMFIHTCFDNTVFREKFRLVMEGESIEVRLESPYFKWRDYRPMFRIMIPNKKFKPNCTDENKAFMFLYMKGYLTLSENIAELSNNTVYHFESPNLEISKTFQMKWDYYFKLLLGVPEHEADQMPEDF